ncbi:MAG: hypothetical protein QM572_19515 [Nocardioides sp.]|uniref:hypothetical protein n=1 Tax=Nocardioides sp. TaxID=35761 RepID=UPI0039E21C81
MTETDLTRRPSGQMSWAALVAYAASADDRLERYFLELKSDVDLNTTHGRHKVAKFILGAANRDPAQAARRFDGCAVMLLGVGNGVAHGIPGFEAKDLARDVAKFTGPDGPRWDFEQIPGIDGRDVIAIIVDPPTGVPYPCLADGEGLKNGDVYLRADGETRKATGSELQGMFARVSRNSADVAVQVEVVGEVNAISVSRELLLEGISAEAEDLRESARPKPVAGQGSYARILSNVSLAGSSLERRSKKEFEAEVAAWETAARANPVGGVHDLAAAIFTGIQVRVTNLTRTFLRDVRVDIEIGDDVAALWWEEPDDAQNLNGLPAEVPLRWGTDSFSASLARLGVASPTAPLNRDGLLRIEGAQPARLSLFLKTLRPEEAFTSADDDVVLVIVSDDGTASNLVSGRWKLTAGDVHDVFEDGLTFEVAHLDWNEPMRKLLRLDQQDEEG